MKNKIHPLFATHKLNMGGVSRLQVIREGFTELLGEIEQLGITQGREYAIMKSKLEEACHAAIKSVSVDPQFQEAE